MIFFSITTLFSFIILFLFLCFWLIHIAQVREFTKQYGKGSFIKFKREYNKIEWERDEDYRLSHFGLNTNSSVHAGVIKFNGKGMTLGFLSYVVFSLWVFMHVYTAKSSVRKSQKTSKW